MSDSLFRMESKSGRVNVVLVAVVLVNTEALLALFVAFWVHRQNQRVLANRADEKLQARLQGRGFLRVLAQDVTVPEIHRRRAQALARDYPSGDQLHVFVERLADDLRGATGRS